MVSVSLWPGGLLEVRILQDRILEWVAVPFSRGFSQPRGQTQVSCNPGGLFTSWAAREAHDNHLISQSVTSCQCFSSVLNLKTPRWQWELWNSLFFYAQKTLTQYYYIHLVLLILFFWIFNTRKSHFPSICYGGVVYAPFGPESQPLHWVPLSFFYSQT